MQYNEVLAVFAHLKNEDYTAAASDGHRTAADEMIASRADWKYFFDHLIPLLASDEGVWSMLNDSSEADYYRDLAGTEGAAGQACAQALLRLVFDETHEYPLVFPPDPSGERRAVSGISETAGTGHLIVFPNPSGRSFSLLLEKDIQDATFLVYDAAGTLVKQGEIRSRQTIIDLASLPASLYLCKVFDKSGANVGTVKLMKSE